MSWAAVVFDFDGTLVDTESAEFRSWTTVFERRGAQLRLEEWVKCVGAPPGTWSAFSHLQDLIGPLSEPEVIQERESELEQELTRLTWMPGARETVDHYRGAGVPVGVATNSNMAWIKRITGVLGIEGLFPVIVTRDDVPRPKPAPDSFREACRRLGADPADCLAFEDSPSGLAAAKAAGMSVAVTPNELTRGLDLSAADWLLDRIRPIPR